MRDSIRSSGGNHSVTDKDIQHSDDDNAAYRQSSDSGSNHADVQAGVKRIEAVSKSWTKTSLIIAYVAYVTSCTSSSS